MNIIRFVGYDGTHGSDFWYEVSESRDYYLILLINSPSYITIDGKRQEYPEHTVIIASPNTSVRYGANKTDFENDWLWISSDEKMLASFPQLNQPFQVADHEYLHSLFKLLTWETSSYLKSTREVHHSGETIPEISERYGFVIPERKNCESNEDNIVSNQLVIEHILQILFEKLNDEIRANITGGRCNQLFNLRRKLEKNPEKRWTVADMAASVFMSEGHLQMLYKKQYGISCMDDLINIRLQKATDYLCFTTNSVAEIADLCGYVSHEHFSRQFKARYGMSPLKYRRKSHEQKNEQ